MEEVTRQDQVKGQASSSAKVSYSQVVKLAGAMITAIIGSGFSSGEEILQFFSVYGIRGMISALLVLVVLAITSGLIMQYGFSHPSNPPKTVFKYYVGKVFGSFLNIYIPILAFLIGVVTVSGAGAAINQYFGLANFWGTALITIIVLLAVLLGFDRLINVLGALGPITLIASIGIGLYTLLTNFSAFQVSGAYLQVANQYTDVPYGAGNGMGFWWLAGILFISYTMMGAIPFISQLGTRGGTKKESFLGGVLGGVGLMVTAIFLNLAMLTDIEQVLNVEVPVLYLAQAISPVVGGIFIYVLLQEMFTTSCAFLWTVSDAITQKSASSRVKKWIIVLISLATLAGAQLPFRTLVNIVYPISGYIGIIFLVALFAKEAYRLAQSKKA